LFLSASQWNALPHCHCDDLDDWNSQLFACRVSIDTARSPTINLQKRNNTYLLHCVDKLECESQTSIRMTSLPRNNAAAYHCAANNLAPDCYTILYNKPCGQQLPTSPPSRQCNLAPPPTTPPNKTTTRPKHRKTKNNPK
jgi:hypothetical protein